MPERLECEVLQKARYINTLTFTYLKVKTNNIVSMHRFLFTLKTTADTTLSRI